MDFETSRLVGFVALAERGEGIMARSPEELETLWQRCIDCTNEAELGELLGDGLVWRLSNYHTVWGTAPQPAPAMPEPAPQPAATIPESTPQPAATMPEPAPQPAPKAEPPKTKKRGKRSV